MYKHNNYKDVKMKNKDIESIRAYLKKIIKMQKIIANFPKT
jgi:hypothetical protein